MTQNDHEDDEEDPKATSMSAGCRYGGTSSIISMLSCRLGGGFSNYSINVNNAMLNYG
jgi:hypothetical protein